MDSQRKDSTRDFDDFDLSKYARISKPSSPQLRAAVSDELDDGDSYSHVAPDGVPKALGQQSGRQTMQLDDNYYSAEFLADRNSPMYLQNWPQISHTEDDYGAEEDAEVLDTLDHGQRTRMNPSDSISYGIFDEAEWSDILRPQPRLVVPQTPRLSSSPCVRAQGPQLRHSQLFWGQNVAPTHQPPSTPSAQSPLNSVSHEIRGNHGRYPMAALDGTDWFDSHIMPYIRSQNRKRPRRAKADTRASLMTNPEAAFRHHQVHVPRNPTLKRCPACVPCYQRKVKCDRRPGGCMSCTKAQILCSYKARPPPRQRKKAE
ncbi:hypothetical protein EK21DRAFT_90688 [Setomelanomma holmii]|uniref:Zn(2)-C6 fungal-type domain-containing protein n=1 Tax=Setomelanomma holmii TaxID=210430 RepID=A0A9P4H569_9PLEO|nr:hypothetical protein EK21DRAFT_90688 [Setomelanomma holmii]